MVGILNESQLEIKVELFEPVLELGHNNLMNQTLTSTVQTPAFKITASPRFSTWLAEQNLSLAFTTYQTNRLFFISCQTNGRLKFHERLFDKPMGLYADSDRLYMSTRYLLYHKT